MEPKKRILVVEDDRGIRETVQMMLEFEGYEVAAAADGAEALAVLAREPPFGLILLDLMMPVMNGWEFAEKVQETPAWAGIPIILLTAFSAEAGTIKGVRLIIQKPVDVDRLLRSVRTYCA